MPKKRKVIKNGNGGQPEPGASSAEAQIDKGKARLTSPGGQNGRPARKKRSAAPRRRAKRKPTEPPDEEIRLRAYFVSERRHRLGLAGDASSDWLEAKRQLLSEWDSR